MERVDEHMGDIPSLSKVLMLPSHCAILILEPSEYAQRLCIVGFMIPSDHDSQTVMNLKKLMIIRIRGLSL
jgi:hypothetical protein